MIATEFWQPCFSKFAFFLKIGCNSIVINGVTILHLMRWNEMTFLKESRPFLRFSIGIQSISPCQSLLGCNVFNLIYFDWSRSFWIRRWARLIVHGFAVFFFYLKFGGRSVSGFQDIEGSFWSPSPVTERKKKPGWIGLKEARKCGLCVTCINLGYCTYLLHRLKLCATGDFSLMALWYRLQKFLF